MWSRQHWICAGTTALATFGLTVALFWPTIANAVDEKAATTVVSVPTLKVDSSEITARFAKSDLITEEKGVRLLKPGAIPPIEIIAYNRGEKEQTFNFTATLIIASMNDRMSRVPRVAKPSWEQEYTLTLQPGQSRTVTVETAEKAGSLGQVTLNLKADKQLIEALTISTAGEAPPAAKTPRQVAATK